jgi:hypothetical protein
LKTKPRMTFPQIVHLMRRRFFLETQNQRFLQRVRANNGIMYTGAEGVGRLDGWKNVIFAKNGIVGDAMFDSHTMQGMPAGIRKGGAWKKTNLCEESRTKKFSQPTKDSAEERRLNGMISKICTRADPHHGVVADTQLQSRARAVRAKRGNGSKPAAATAALHRSLSRSGRVSAGGGPGRRGAGGGADEAGAHLRPAGDVAGAVAGGQAGGQTQAGPTHVSRAEKLKTLRAEKLKTLAATMPAAEWQEEVPTAVGADVAALANRMNQPKRTTMRVGRRHRPQMQQRLPGRGCASQWSHEQGQRQRARSFAGPLA